MNDDRDLERIEQLLRQAAADVREAYPPTPPIAASVRRQLQAHRRAPLGRPRLRLLFRAAAVALAAFVALLAISPGVREAVARFFGLDTVRIQFVATPPAPTGRPTSQPTIQPVSELAGQTSLADARAQARFAVRLPAYPAGLGQPIRAYFQDFEREFRGAQQVILVYPDFTLYEAEGVIYQKSVAEATVVEEVEVGGRPGLWLTGAAHIVQVRDASGELSLDFRRVEGSVLAWEADGITYRIETQLPLSEALKIAESMR